MRETSRASSICSSTACCSDCLRSRSILSRPSAWGTVRGNPSRMKLGVPNISALTSTSDPAIGTRDDIPALALLVVVQLLLDHADDDVIADKAARVHNLLGFHAQLRLLGDLGSQHVAGGLVVANEPTLAIGAASSGVEHGPIGLPDDSS